MFDDGRARYCEACQMWLPTEGQWQDHLTSKKPRGRKNKPRRPVAAKPGPEPTMAGAREVIRAFIRLDHATPEPLLPLPLQLVHQYLFAGVVPPRRDDYLRQRALRDARWGERQRRPLRGAAYCCPIL